MSADDDLIVQEANRLAELQLTSQVNLMLAADQRATTFAGIMIAAVAVIAQKYEADTSVIYDDIGLLLLGISAAVAAFSARSVKVHVAGNAFASFEEDFKSKKEFRLLLRDLGTIYDECSTLNRSILKRNGRLFNVSLYLGVLGFVTTMWPSIVTLAKAFGEALSYLTGRHP
jgi:hypothetical protein